MRLPERLNGYYVKYVARPLRRMDGHDPVVALTFDDGPNPQATAHILDTLARERVPATFFVLGRHAERWPELVRRAQDEGHLVGNHTFGHSRLPECSPQQVWRELRRGGEAIKEASGDYPRYFRAPYGSMNLWVDWSARWQRMRAAQWSLGTWDTNLPGAEVIARTTIEATKPGEVVLLHDGDADDPLGDRMQTAEALPLIIAGLRARGFSFVRIDGRASPERS